MPDAHPTDTPPVAPYLYYRDAEAALAWLVKHFGGEARFVRRLPDGMLAHAELRLEGGAVLLGPALVPLGTAAVQGPEEPVHASVHVFVDDVDAWHAKLRAAELPGLSDVLEPYPGGRLFVARDLEGQRWIFNRRHAG